MTTIPIKSSKYIESFKKTITEHVFVPQGTSQAKEKDMQGKWLTWVGDMGYTIVPTLLMNFRRFAFAMKRMDPMAGDGWGCSRQPQVGVAELMHMLYNDGHETHSLIIDWIIKKLILVYLSSMVYDMHTMEDDWGYATRALCYSLQQCVCSIGAGDVKYKASLDCPREMGFTIKCSDGVVYIGIERSSDFGHVDIFVDSILYGNGEVGE